MSGNAPVDPAEVPVFTGNLAVLDEKVKAISSGGAAVSTKASDVHTSFGGLQAFYQAPEADQLFATTKPVSDLGLKLSSDMCTIAGALGTYSRDAAPIIKKLENLKREAETFRSETDKDKKWREDGDLIDENLDRRNEIAEVWTQFQEVERACHAKIVALVPGGKALKKDDGSHGEGMYGYDAEALKQSKSLPWGDAVEESIPGWQVWEHAWEFTKGFVVDGVWGTLKGLGGLVGLQGWDTFKQSWTGLAKLGTGLAIMSIPGAGPLFLAAPDDKLPSWLRESRTAMKETGKALVAWDQWGSNPGRAAGAVTFNVITTIATGGTGGAVSGAGKAGAVAKALSLAGKAGRVVDPMTYIFKGAGAGISKAGDVMAALKGMGNIDVKIADGAFALPEGALKLPDGSIQLPKGTAIPDGAVKLPDGNIQLPEGTATLPPGTVKLPFDDSPAKYVDGDGNLYKEDGSVLQRGDESPVEKTPGAGADTPRVDAPKVDSPATVKVPERELAGVGGRGGDIHLGSNISDPVHAMDNGAHGTGGFDNTPTGRAGDHGTPGGHAPDNMPRNDLDNTPRGGSHPDTPSTAGTHPDGPGSGATHPDGPGGTGHTDGPSTGSTHGDGPGTGGTHLPDNPGAGGVDDAARAGDDAAGGGARDGEEPMTAERRKELQDKHVWLANNDEAWRSTHYNTLNRRKRIETLVDGVELPQLTKNADGDLIPVHDLPSGPREVRLAPEPFKLDTVPEGNLSELHKVMGDRRVSVNLTNAEVKLKEVGSQANRDAVAEAQKAFDKRLPGVANNSKISEALGNKAAVLHVIPEAFPKADIIHLPKTPNGANMFDGAYKLPDDWRLIVEEKAPANGPDWRQGKADPDPLNPSDHGGAQGMRVQQGTRPYIRTILAEMTSRGGKDAEIAADLRAALKAGRLKYVLIKAKEDLNGNGEYAGGSLEEFVH